MTLKLLFVSFTCLALLGVGCMQPEPDLASNGQRLLRFDKEGITAICDGPYYKISWESLDIEKKRFLNNF